MISVGYPAHLINPNEASRAGIEAIAVEDIGDIYTNLSRRRLARLHEIGIVRTPIPQDTRKGPRTRSAVFALEWGQPKVTL